MSTTAVFGLVPNATDAERLANQLKAAGLSANDISVLFPDRAGARDFAAHEHTMALDVAAAAARTASLFGGGLGWLVGMGILAIPGFGPVIAAGPLMAALGGTVVGAAIGGLGGALVGLGVPEYEARQYEGKLRGGNILVSVHVENRREADRAREIFEREGAHDIAASSEASVRESA